MVKDASLEGIGISSKAAKQLSSSGKAAKEKRKDYSTEAKNQGGSSKDQAK